MRPNILPSQREQYRQHLRSIEVETQLDHFRTVLQTMVQKPDLDAQLVFWVTELIVRYDDFKTLAAQPVLSYLFHDGSLSFSLKALYAEAERYADIVEEVAHAALPIQKKMSLLVPLASISVGTRKALARLDEMDAVEVN